MARRPKQDEQPAPDDIPQAAANTNPTAETPQADAPQEAENATSTHLPTITASTGADAGAAPSLPAESEVPPTEPNEAGPNVASGEASAPSGESNGEETPAPEPSVPPPTVDDIRRIKKEAEAELLQRPGVTGVGVGYKYVGGQRTDEIAITVSVAQKRDVSPEETIPPVINGIKTDVVQKRYVLHVSVPLQQLLPEADTETYDPLVGGVSIGPCRVINGNILAGTLGAIVADNRTGQQMLLSNYHVMAVNADARVGDTISQPSRVDTGDCPANVVGTLRRAALGNEVDCAVALIGGRAANAGQIADIGAINGTETAQLGMAVRKRGRTTGLTFGLVDAVDVTLTLDYEIGSRTLSNQIGITVDATQSAQFGNSGDSGSVVVNEVGNVVGLYFAGTDDGSAGVANPIQSVLTALNIRMITSQGGNLMLNKSVQLDKVTIKPENDKLSLKSEKLENDKFALKSEQKDFQKDHKDGKEKPEKAEQKDKNEKLEHKDKPEKIEHKDKHEKIEHKDTLKNEHKEFAKEIEKIQKDFDKLQFEGKVAEKLSDNPPLVGGINVTPQNTFAAAKVSDKILEGKHFKVEQKENFKPENKELVKEKEIFKEHKESKDHKDQKDHKDKDKDKDKDKNEKHEHKEIKPEFDKTLHKDFQKSEFDINQTKQVGKEFTPEKIIDTPPVGDPTGPITQPGAPVFQAQGGSKNIGDNLTKSIFTETTTKHTHKDFQKPEFDKFQVKEFISEKHHHKELIKDIVDTPVGPVGPIGPVGPGPVEQRLAGLEQTVNQLTHFITQNLRPDLSGGALTQEQDVNGQNQPDPAAISQQLQQAADAAKQAKDNKDIEKLLEG